MVDRLLGLRSVLLSVALYCLGGVSGVLVSKTLDLGRLLASNLTTLLKLSINGLLVLDVDEGTEEGDERGNQSQAPERDELDEEVRNQGCEESL